MLLKGKSPTKPLVVAIEAVSDNAQALKRNIDLNGLAAWAYVVEAALGDFPDVVDIQVEGDLKAGEGTGTANILPKGSILDPNQKYKCERIPLRVTTLDHLLADGSIPANCTLVKIDVDGYDLKAIQGGRKFFEENRPAIYGEFAAHCLNWHGQSVLDVANFASEIGYQIYVRTKPTGWKFRADFDVDTYVQDLLLLPSESTRPYSWCLT